MHVSATNEWLTEWASAVAKGAAGDLDLPALAATLAEVTGDEGHPDPEDLELLGDVLLDIDRTREAWLEQARTDERLQRASARLRAAFRRASDVDADERRASVSELLALAGGLAERRLKQVEWARDRREKRALARTRPLPLQLGDDGRHGEVVDARTNLEATEAARLVAGRLRQTLAPNAIAAMRELLIDGGSDTAGAIAARHGLSAPTLSRAKNRLGEVAAEVLREYPDAARRPFWDALAQALEP
jgi:hypothetical protein